MAEQRNTKQRETIRQVIEDEDRPLSPQEILDSAQQEIPGLGQATVYRTIKLGVEEGWLQTVALPGEPDRYEPAGKDHHHHFECIACGRVFDIEGCPPGIKTLLPKGFTLTRHEIMLYGLCDACA